VEIEARKVRMVEVEGKEQREKVVKKIEEKKLNKEEKKAKAMGRIRIKEERTREEKCIYKEIDERIRKKKN